MRASAILSKDRIDIILNRLNDIGNSIDNLTREVKQIHSKLRIFEIKAKQQITEQILTELKYLKKEQI